MLDELHEGHRGVAKMKALARSYVWWPGIDKAIEQVSKGCTGCQLTQNNPKTAPREYYLPVRSMRLLGREKLVQSTIRVNSQPLEVS